MSKISISFDFVWWIVIAGVVALAGWLVYDSFKGAAFTLIVFIVLSIVALISLIPILGTILYYLWLGPLALHFLINHLGFYATWLTTLIFIGVGLMGIIWAVIFGIFILVAISQ